MSLTGSKRKQKCDDVEHGEMQRIKQPVTRSKTKALQSREVLSTAQPTSNTTRRKTEETIDKIQSGQPSLTGEDHGQQDTIGGYPTTPDCHYFVVRGRLWRCANPALSTKARSQLQRELMAARRNLTARVTDASVRSHAREEVQRCKVALGERGDIWWEEGEVVDRKMVWNTGYKDWWEGLSDEQRKGQKKSKKES